MIEHWQAWINDLISFYKEFDDLRDQTKLINNCCHVEGQSVTEAIEKRTRNMLRVSEQIVYVFKDKNPPILDTLTRFMYSCIAWHLSDESYRIDEIYEQISESNEVELKFRRYYEDATVGRIDLEKWAGPLVIESTD